MLLENRKRIELPLPADKRLEEALLDSGVQSLSMSSKIAYLAGSLLEHHKDLADRIIIATSILNNMQLISFDTAFPFYIELNGRLISYS